MKNLLLLVITTVIFASPVWAEKPDKAIKPSMEEKVHHNSERIKEHREDADHDMMEMREEKEKRAEKEKNDAAGMEKQSETKTAEAMKELDKGSEQGRESRQEHRKKWWKFWE